MLRFKHRCLNLSCCFAYEGNCAADGQLIKVCAPGFHDDDAAAFNLRHLGTGGAGRTSCVVSSQPPVDLGRACGARCRIRRRRRRPRRTRRRRRHLAPTARLTSRRWTPARSTAAAAAAAARAAVAPPDPADYRDDLRATTMANVAQAIPTKYAASKPMSGNPRRRGSSVFTRFSSG